MFTEKDSARPAGESFVWLTAMGLAVGVIMVIGLLSLILWNGVEVFWPRTVAEVHLKEEANGIQGSLTFAGIITKDREKLSSSMGAQGSGIEEVREYQFFTGNKDVYGFMFKFYDTAAIESMSYPKDIMIAERTEWGNAIFYPISLNFADGKEMKVTEPGFHDKLDDLIGEFNARREAYTRLEKSDIGKINTKMDDIRIKQNALRHKYGEAAETMDEMKASLKEEAELDQEFAVLDEERRALREQQEDVTLKYKLVSGQEKTIAIGHITHAYQPNIMSLGDKIVHFVSHFWRFLIEDPRESNTEGGIFPAIFGTFVMTVLMSAAVMPFGVLAAIYLREYAKQGPFVRSVRIAVNNLAGVPSIVYGVFGLGFFVYFLGAHIDSWFYADRLLQNRPTFGTGGIMWASLTLALMTVPVVVVATEEALASVPRGMREASLACGASKWQTIQRIVLPASAPGILTGLILAMARGAGEVAPLMLVGVVKLAPTLPMDMTFPFIHLDRKFMHLGFHIYDLGFQSPDSEAAKPMVFATTFLLILLVVVLNLGAIMIRNYLRKRYASSVF